MHILLPHCAAMLLSGTVQEPLRAPDCRNAEHLSSMQAYGSRHGMPCRVLVMERLYGVPLTDLAAIRSITTADPEATLTAALNTWFGSLLGCSTFHADVHAGQCLGRLNVQPPATHRACSAQEHWCIWVPFSSSSKHHRDCNKKVVLACCHQYGFMSKRFGNGCLSIC